MSQFYEQLAEILEVSPETITPEFNLAAHGWDSLAVISCVALIDEIFGKLVSGSILAKCTTVADIEKLISQTASD
ncbi:acyl carrier protein [Gluconacetobacter azotocaptans]|uniref:acyl carrier protein n=1 Tax=Gluconacetobacter azotocaptans TaxID=142834 RepID=UPI001958B898|nr:acyl carrier protein [Gluconacetobacter azotocaptans]MBM9403562.1 acyl carrier protein [Gluconacetobacter azotocaptans]